MTLFFSDDFESGNLGAWDAVGQWGSGGSAAVAPAYRIHGARGCRLYHDAGSGTVYLRKYLGAWYPSRADVYARFYLRTASVGAVDGDSLAIAYFSYFEYTWADSYIADVRVEIGRAHV